MRVIAIDGPSGSGKSTVARAVADKLGADYLDTGAMYRAIAFAAIRHGIDPADAEPVAQLARTVRLDMDDGIKVDGVDATIEIRSLEVTRAVSAVAANPEVRATLVEHQRRWAERHGGGVVEGRDIGTTVFPEADLKVYLTAADSERAERRSRELLALHYHQVAADMVRRDHADSTRSTSPLRVADDAVRLDTTGLSVDQVVTRVLSLVPGVVPDSDASNAGTSSMDSSGVAGEEPPVGASRSTAGVRRLSSTGTASTVKDQIFAPPTRAQLAWYAFARQLVEVFCRLFWKVTVTGKEHVPASGPFILAPVHRSNVDTLLCGCVTRRRLRFMGKDSLWSNKLSAALFSSLGGFAIHRGTPDREALRITEAAAAAGEPVVMFPEGTRRSGPVVQPLMEGAVFVAARAAIPIVPLGIGGSEWAMPKGSRALRPARVAIVVGAPIEPPSRVNGGRPSRRKVREATEALHQTLQALFDEALERAGR